METKTLCLLMLLTGCSLILTSLIFPEWSCGSLFKSCIGEHNKAVGLAVLCLLLIGLVCIVTTIVLDLLARCVRSIREAAVMHHVRLLLLLLGVALCCASLLVYTAYKSRDFGFLSATVGTTMALQVALITLKSSRCVVYQPDPALVQNRVPS